MFILELNSIGNNIEGDIYIGAQTPFKYHEAFHGVFRMLLTEEEISRYLKIAKEEKLSELKKEGKTLTQALNELRSSHSIYSKMTKEELTDRLYEEYLADKFDEFKMNQNTENVNGFFKSLFEQIIKWIKSIFKNFKNYYQT